MKEKIKKIFSLFPKANVKQENKPLEEMEFEELNSERVQVYMQQELRWSKAWLRKEKENLDRERKELEEEKEKWKESRKALETEILELEKKRDDLLKEIFKKKTSFPEYDQVKKMREEQDNLFKHIREKDGEIAHLSSEAKIRQGNIEELESRISREIEIKEKISLELGEKDRKLIVLQSDLEWHKTRVKELSEYAKKTEEKQEILLSELKEKENKISGLMREVEVQKEREGSLKREMEWKGSRAAQKAEFLDRKTKLKDRIGELETEKSNFEKEKAGLEDKLRREERQNVQLGQQLKNEADKRKMAEEGADILKQKLREEAIKFSDLKKELEGAYQTVGKIKSGEKISGLDFSDLIFGFAHQIKNPLGVISSAAQLRLDGVSVRDRDVFERIYQNVHNAEKIIEEFLQFSQPVIFAPARVNLRHLFKEIEAILNDRVQSEKIKIDIRIAENIGEAFLDKDKIKEVLLHILLNSIESMKKGGGIEIDVYTVKDSGDLAIEIKDSGEGIHPDNIKRVFHPFFTTKEGRVGLGLTVVRQIIQAHKGTVNLKSEQGKGTEILITIPFTPGDLASCEDFGGS
ncbi:MAG TPA: ATP-binding protein [bacterium]|nr:ATP-binding protein [bacterium]